MDISIIIPFYKGNNYLERLLNSVELAIKKANLNGIKVEVILVNDSPEYNIIMPVHNRLAINIIKHKQNLGIHQARITGLKRAVGKYVQFLDQDDELTVGSLVSNYNKVSNYDVIIGNGYFNFNQTIVRKIYSSVAYQKKATQENPYLKVRDLIVSPGQCLVKKEAIPEYWVMNPMLSNGADDYLLWLLMFDQKKKFGINPDLVYIHHDSGENISFDFEIMKKSTNNLISMLEKNMDFPKQKTKLVSRMLNYKHKLISQNKLQFFMASLQNMDLFIVNLFFRFRYSGAVISNQEMRIKNEK
ncbi:glycosyltransferase family 2 protein [Candidatus Enterococcus ikei]|uniref:Glycosyltransferase family 2 protein n=1 Tax=Candidatus Enterococcus ikei TaxID=2815326 RepID=A0ABS3H035_9ENTE|nr:glycosyltransferase family 2 protein [Enterococcus sp. DIV0869a]MBO0440376.1 glycosyltransferase family 2 protein [Enterococcus sp. DIV0869a]